MVYHQAPEKLRRNIIIRMDDTVAGTYDGFGIREVYRRVLQQLVDGFAHDFHITLNSTLTENIRLKVCK